MALRTPGVRPVEIFVDLVECGVRAGGSVHAGVRHRGDEHRLFVPVERCVVRVKAVDDGLELRIEREIIDRRYENDGVGIEKMRAERFHVVGGGHWNAAFLAAGLLDEVSVLIGAGIDGRGGMSAVFDGLSPEKDVTPLALESVQAFESGAVWLRYKVK